MLQGLSFPVACLCKGVIRVSMPLPKIIGRRLPFISLVICGMILLFFPSGPLSAAEVDSVTPRVLDIALDDSRMDINAIFDARLREGVGNANPPPEELDNLQPSEMCNEDALYRELRKAIFNSFTASLGLKGYGLDTELRELLAKKSFGVELKDSIYRDISYLEGFSLNLKELSRVVNIDGHLIGLDKLGHFFAEGWEYFNGVGGIDEAIRRGRELEEGFFGKVTTGIYSYGDLVANFNGYRFWTRVLGERRDPLLGWFANVLRRPYVQCRVQLMASLTRWRRIERWEYSGGFDIGDYVDGTWDEANNCNSYKNIDIATKVAQRIHEISPVYNCPLDPQQCVNGVEKYGAYGVWLLHPRCLVPGISTPSSTAQ